MKPTACTLCLSSIVPCATADTFKSETVDGSKFLQFCKYFNVNLPLRSLSWDFDRELVPLCRECQSVASSLLILHDELSTLEKLVKETETNVRERITASQKLLNQCPVEDNRILALRHFINGPVILLDRTEVSPPYLIVTPLRHTGTGAEVKDDQAADLDDSHETTKSLPEEQNADFDDKTEESIPIAEPSWHNNPFKVDTEHTEEFEDDGGEQGANDCPPTSRTVKLESAKWDDEDGSHCHEGPPASQDNVSCVNDADNFDSHHSCDSEPNTASQQDLKLFQVRPDSETAAAMTLTEPPVVLLPIPEIKFEEVVIDDDDDAGKIINAEGLRRNPPRRKRPSKPLLSPEDSEDEDETSTKHARTGSPDPEYGESESAGSSDHGGDGEDYDDEIPENSNGEMPEMSNEEAEKSNEEIPEKSNEETPEKSNEIAAKANDEIREVQNAIIRQRSKKRAAYKLRQLEDNRWSYGEHQVTKVKEGIFSCPLCKEKFDKLSQATQHIRKCHLGSIQQNSGPVTCKLCKKTFKKQIYLRDHFTRVHSDERQHVCHDCGMSFKELSKLNLHIRAVHQKEKRHKCEICGDAFFTPFSLKQHMFTHSSERAFECKICGRRMTQLPGLRRHMKEFHANQRQESSATSPLGTESAANAANSEPPPVVTTETTVKKTADVICTKSLTCKICQRQYKNLFQLTKHVLQIHHIHLKDVPFKSLKREGVKARGTTGGRRPPAEVVTRGVGMMEEKLSASEQGHLTLVAP